MLQYINVNRKSAATAQQEQQQENTIESSPHGFNSMFTQMLFSVLCINSKCFPPLILICNAFGTIRRIMFIDTA